MTRSHRSRPDTGPAPTTRAALARRPWPILVVGVVLALLGLGAGSVQAASADDSPSAPGPKTIVSITGDAPDGFHVTHYDGTVRYTETDSEAAAECEGYDTRVARVRCRTGVRRYYADLQATKDALDWAHAQTAGD